MWKVQGYIVYTGEYPIDAKYMIYDQVNEELMWVDDSNNATVFSTVKYAEYILSRFKDIDMTQINFRTIVTTDQIYIK